MTNHQFSTGAQRSTLKPRFDLVLAVWSAIERVANRFALGVPRYGEHNYKKGLPYNDTINHVLDHIAAYTQRRKAYFALKEAGQLPETTLTEWMSRTATDGDDLAAAAWGLLVIMQLEHEGRLTDE